MTTATSAPARSFKIRVTHAIFAGAATIATLALFNAAHAANADNGVASGSVHPAGQASNVSLVAEPTDPGWNSDPGWDFQSS
jgi:hypothetical protein